MKIFTNKNIWSKLVIAVLIVFAFQFVTASSVNTVNAVDPIEFGGKLMSPILSLIVSLGDGIVQILHTAIMGQDIALIHVDFSQDWTDYVAAIFVGVVTFVAVVAACLLIASGIGAIVAAVSSAAVTAITGTTILVSVAAGAVAAFAMAADFLPDQFYLPAYTYSPEEIFMGNILLFNVDFFNVDDGSNEIYVYYTDVASTNNNGNTTGNNTTTVTTTNNSSQDGGETIDESRMMKKEDWENGGSSNKELKGYYYKDDSGVWRATSPQDSATILQSTVSSWYKSIRNICIVAMLSVLIYIGIRMLLSSIAADKAKYKTMLKDWVVGLCLLFVMHYIMAFSVELVGKVTDIVSASINKNGYTAKIEDKNNKLKDMVKEEGIDAYYDNGYLYWPTNLMGYLRIQLQTTENTGAEWGMALMFVVLVIFTVMFTFTYLRRLLYMAFLTIIAPLVALTYCIDKLNDGQAQGFNAWLKEYIFNLLIQPMHLLLYYILITSAIELAEQNVIYSIVAIGFMLPAEKLLRRLFGFEKSQSAPSLAGPAVTAGVVSATQKLLSYRGKGGRSSSDSSNNRLSSGDDNGKTPRTGMNTDTLAKLGRGNEPSTKQEKSSDVDGQEPRFANVQEEDEGIHPVVGMGGTNTALGSSGTTREQEVIGNPNTNETVLTSEQQGYDAEIIGTNGANVNLDTPDTIRTSKIEQPEGEQPEIESGSRKDRIKNWAQGIPSRTASEYKKNKAEVRRIGKSIQSPTTLKAVGGRVGRGVWRTSKKVAKGAVVGAPIGIAAATFGAAAGVALGDPGKVTALTGAGASVGLATGKRVTNAEISQEVKDAYNSVYNGPEFEAEAKQDKINTVMQDSNFNNELRTAWGEDKLKEMKNNGTIENYIKNGRKSAKEIIDGEKLREKGYTKDVDETCAVMDASDALGKSLGDMSDETREKVVETWDGRFSGQFGKNTQRAQQQTDIAMGAMHAYQQIAAGNGGKVGNVGSDKSQIDANSRARLRARNRNTGTDTMHNPTGNSRRV